MTVSRGLTNLGQMAAVCPVRGDVAALEEMTQVLTVGLFDGIGALRVAADAAGLPVAGHVSVEINPRASRVLEARFPGTLIVEDVEKVDREMVKQWACQYTQVGLVVLGAGPPGLNADRKGALKDHRSRLFAHVPRIRRLLQQAFPWAQVQLLAESVQSMDSSDRAVMSEAFGCQACAIDAHGVSLARRPRLYWITWELEDGPGAQVVQPTDANGRHMVVSRWKARCRRKGISPQGGNQGVLTSSQPLLLLDRGLIQGAGRLELTNSRMRNMLAGNRMSTVSHHISTNSVISCGEEQITGCWGLERKVIMGFPRGYTVACFPKAKQGSSEHNDERLTLIGNSWNVTVVCWILSQCIEATAPGPQRDLTPDG